jgi:hypothetical protein
MRYEYIIIYDTCFGCTYARPRPSVVAAVRLSPFHCHVCGLRGLNTGEPAVWGPQLVDQCLAMVIFHGILFEVHVILCEYSWINL